MKTCGKCNEEKDLSEFYSKGKSGYTNSYCKTCFNRYCQDRWIQKKLDAIAHLGGKCMKCGYDKYYGALEFHHRDPNQKDADWKRLRTMKEERWKAEIDKCDLLCANCHREVHGDVV